MSGQQQPQSRSSGQSHTESTKSKRPTADDVRSSRADEFERKGLEDPDAFKACLAAIQAEQIRIGFALGQVVKQALANPPNTPEKLQIVEPSMNLYLRVTRQIERFHQLEIRQSKTEQKASKMTSYMQTSDRRSDESEGERLNNPK